MLLLWYTIDVLKSTKQIIFYKVVDFMKKFFFMVDLIAENFSGSAMCECDFDNVDIVKDFYIINGYEIINIRYATDTEVATAKQINRYFDYIA